ncbi:hypothetical protein ABIB25_004204 [Nakamurella sp. UYEF19]|uniref:hypothetical protein n=1 Tax=Nakamurella sp. UYEF19 TaxID=1756392 RepID=UPI003391F97E
MDLSVDDPGVVGSYGTGHPASGQMELPRNGCDPALGTQIYTVYANCIDGTVVQRTINWTPPPVIG